MIDNFLPIHRQITATIEDPTIYKDVKRILQEFGYARTAPDPK